MLANISIQAGPQQRGTFISSGRAKARADELNCAEEERSRLVRNVRAQDKGQ